MKFLIILSVFLIITVTSCWARDLIVGTSYNARLTWQEKAEYMAFPFKKRVKEVFYSDPGQQILKGIVVRDLDKTEGSATITSLIFDLKVNAAEDSIISLSFMFKEFVLEKCTSVN